MACDQGQTRVAHGMKQKADQGRHEEAAGLDQGSYERLVEPGPGRRVACEWTETRVAHGMKQKSDQVKHERLADPGPGQACRGGRASDERVLSGRPLSSLPGRL